MSLTSLNYNLHRSENEDLHMGTPGYGAPFHIDEVKHPSWQAQIKGAKTWYDGVSLIMDPKELNIKLAEIPSDEL